MSERFYQRAFEQSTVGQWLLDVKPMYQWLLDQQIQDAMQFEQLIEQQGGVPKTLRQCLRAHDINLTARRLLGLDDADDFSFILQEFASDEHVHQLGVALLGIHDQYQVYHYETELIIDPSKSKKRLYINCVMPPLESLDEGVSVNALDISLLSMAESELRERERFVSATLKAVPDVLMIYDLGKREPVFQNVNLAELLGYTDQDIQNTRQRLLDYITHPDDRLTGELFTDIEKTLAAGETYEITMRLQHNNGEWRHYYFRAAALEKDKQGKALNAVVIARDITEVLQNRQILSEHQRRYQLLADNFTDIVLVTDKQLQLQYVSPSIKDCLGYSSGQLMEDGKLLQILGLEAHRQGLLQALAETPVSLEEEREDFEQVFELEAQTSAGNPLPVEVRVSVLRDEYQLLEGLLIVVRDISERLRMEADLRMAAKVFESSHEGIYITGKHGLIVQANESFYRITGYRKEQVIGCKPSQLNSGWHDKSFVEDIKPSLQTNGSWSGELMSRRSNGEAFLIWMSIYEVNDSHEQLIGTITSFRDITEAKSSEESIRKLAYYDPLTDLPNRQLFADRLSQAVQRANRNRQYLAILFMDLDGFKEVNDRHGHATGDKLLTEVGKRLKECIRSDDTVARMGGDEFTVILNALQNRETAETAAAQVAGKIISYLNQSFEIAGREVSIGTSIGIALYPDDSNEQEQLIKMADTAMYHAKQAGKNAYQFYTQDMHQRTAKRMQVEKDIHRALQANEFELAFQPKLIAASGHLYGFESLLRWQHPDRGLLGPVSFIRSLEELGLGDLVGSWVVESACKQLQKWLAHGKHGCCSVSVNVFAKQYRERGLISDVSKALTATRITPELLTIEIPERLVMADMGYAYAIMSDLKDLGVRVALDDFASGMMSVNYLARLPLDEVKIDRQFTEYLDRDGKQYQLVKALVMLARNLNLDVIAQGVERNQQLQLLLEAGCNKVQGFLFCRPVFKEELGEYMQAHQSRHDALIRPPEDGD